ncbi:peroxin, partial [Quaeritorhiza haematococci]
VYLVTLLTLFTHLQLNLLGRFIYLDSVSVFTERGHEQELVGNISSSSSTSNGSKRGLSFDTERKYLTFSWFVLNVGWKRCVERVRKVVEEVVGSMSLKQVTTYESMIELITTIRQRVEYEDAEQKIPFDFSQFLLPTEGGESEVLRQGTVAAAAEAPSASDAAYQMNDELQQLLDETRDFLESPNFKAVISSCVEETFDLLLKSLKPAYYPVEQTQPQPQQITPVGAGAEEVTVEVVESKEIPLAGFLPHMTRVVHQVVNGVPNLFVDVVSSQPDLKAFSVVVYTGWE